MKSYKELLESLLSEDKFQDDAEENSNSNTTHDLDEDLEADDVEEIDELNQDTLLSYYYKAGHDKNDPKKGKKRTEGTQRAMKKIVDKTMGESKSPSLFDKFNDKQNSKSNRTGQRIEARVSSAGATDKTYVGVVTKSFLTGGTIASHNVKLDDGSTRVIHEVQIVKVLKDK